MESIDEAMWPFLHEWNRGLVGVVALPAQGDVSQFAFIHCRMKRSVSLWYC